jgi:hypothetical protein
MVWLGNTANFVYNNKPLRFWYVGIYRHSKTKYGKYIPDEPKRNVVEVWLFQ